MNQFTGRMIHRPNLVWLVAAVVLPGIFAAEPETQVREAMAALQHGDFRTAEQKLRLEVAAHPNDAWALSLLGAALDNLKRIPEAGEFHRRAVAKAPASIEVLNNYAAHLWLKGDQREAGRIYQRVVGLDASNYDANLQLARLALKDRNAVETLRDLDRLSADRQQNPVVLLPRLEALYLSGDRAGGDALAARLSEMSKTDLPLSFAAGVALSNAEQYDKSEGFFETALQGSPSDFNVLYDLGIAATHAGHYQRAREVLEAALREQPRSVDALYGLACADQALNRTEAAAQLLAQAAKLDARRADVQKLLALTTRDLGALDDSAAAWDRYLKLMPGDDAARRERGYTMAQMGQFEKALADLEWFAGKHPDDAAGHYELGQTERNIDMAKALEQFDRALAIDPNYVPARTARGSLYYQEGHPELAIKDLELAAYLRADDASILDRLGQTYQALDRTTDALRVLTKAAALAPADSKILLHFARALADAGKAEESKTAMDRFRQLGSDKKAAVRAGFVDYLSLTPEQRRADYRARLEKALHKHPEDAALQVDYLKLLLEEGDDRQIPGVAHAIAVLKPPAPLLTDAGRALLSAKQYAPASELLAQAASTDRSPAIEIDLAVAAAHNGDAVNALARLNAIPEAERSGDYYLARAEVLEASAQSGEAVAAVGEAMKAAPQRADFYQRAAAFLASRGRMTEAAGVLDQAVRVLPQSREILLARAAADELAGKTEAAQHSLAEIQNRWPEWYPAWAAEGMILDRHGRFAEARKALETAEALGAGGAAVDYYLADSTLRAGAADAAEAAIGRALKRSPGDAWVNALGGRIALQKGNYERAVARLREAVRLDPGLAEARKDLARAYERNGRKQEAQVTLKDAPNASAAAPAHTDPPYLLEILDGSLFR